MRRILLVLALFAVSVALQAQGHGRWEVSAGAVYPMFSVEGYGNVPFGSVAVSYGRVRDGSPFALWFEGALTAAPRKVLAPESEYSSQFESCRTVSLSMVPEFSFRLGGSVDFFVGAGFGVAHRATFRSEFDPGTPLGVCVSPRAGFLFRDRLKVTAGCRLTHRLYDVVGLRLGYCF
jgi:hypothetical protein